MTALAIWQSLDAVHQRTLKVAYDLDQLKERREHDLRAKGHYGRPPASEWRWLFLELVVPLKDSPPDFILGKYLREKKLLAGSEQVLQNLVEFGLLENRKRRTSNGWMARQYRLTPLGRRVVRAGTGENREKPLPTGTLREHHWRALELAFKAGGNGLAASGQGCYGNIPWRTWLRLRNYKAGALVTERGGEWLWSQRKTYVEDGRLREYIPQTPYRLYVTDSGRAYYEREQNRYREMYPDIAVQEG